MMDDKEVSISCIFEEKEESVYPMYFGVSCAFVALRLLSVKEIPEMDDSRWSVITERMLQGSAHLLGLLVWKAQGGEAMEGRSDLLKKLRKVETEIVELKTRRSEDAKANEKVMGIFSTQEQSWIKERKRLRQQIQALLHHLQVLETKKEDTISDLNQKIEEKEHDIESKDKALEEEGSRRKDLEEKLQKAEAAAEELRATAKKQAQERSSELWKHKTAFIELVSNQRQLEAEMGRTFRQVEAMKQELDAVYEQKEESDVMVQKLSAEIVKMQKDVEQKDKILSAMLRKSKSDAAEKHMLLKESKISKARRKQAELEAERWKGFCELRCDKNLRSNSANRGDSRLEMKALQYVEAYSTQNRQSESQPTNSGIIPKTLFHNYFECENKEPEPVAPKRMVDLTTDCFSQYSPEGNGELVITTNAKQLEDWVRIETEKYISILEQRHYQEIDAFAEQMRLKDENLEASRWRLLSLELESKRLQSHIEGLEENLVQFRDANMKLEAMLSSKEKELKSLKEKFRLHFQNFQRCNSNYCLNPQEGVPEAVWSEATMVKRVWEKEQEQKATSVGCPQEVENEIQERENLKDVLEEKQVQTDLQYEQEKQEKENIEVDDIVQTKSIDSEPPFDQIKEHTVVEIYEQSVKEFERRKDPIEDPSQDMGSVNKANKEGIEEDKELGVDPGHVREEDGAIDKLPSAGNSLIKKDPQRKMDIHAMGISYKIKRLKQQLLVLEKLAAMQPVKNPSNKDGASDVQEICEKGANKDGQQVKGIIPVMSLLNKQVNRYQTLEEKTDDLCKRMSENGRDGNSKDSGIGRTKEQTGTLEHFLEETFQLQRYMVATGQKLMEIQSRIACIFVGDTEVQVPVGFDLKQFVDGIRTLFREIQRGLEVRIARIIGDLEGTLACEGILNLKS